MTATLDTALEKWITQLRANYEGELKDEKADGKGKYVFPDQCVYEGDFKEGECHGEGKMTFPGKGSYVATWQNGKAVKATYYFKDGLEYNEKDWSHCTKQDRRFWTEVQHGIKPGDKAQLANDGPPRRIPPETYDIGCGYYSPITGRVYSYTGEELRTPDERERQWILDRCRIGLDE